MWGVCSLLRSPYSGLGFQMKAIPGDILLALPALMVVYFNPDLLRSFLVNKVSQLRQFLMLFHQTRNAFLLNT